MFTKRKRKTLDCSCTSCRSYRYQLREDVELTACMALCFIVLSYVLLFA